MGAFLDRLRSRAAVTESSPPPAALEPSARPALPARSRERLIADGIASTATWSGRLVVIAIALVVLGLVVQVTWSVLLPLLLALILTTVLQPVADVFRRWLPDGLAAATTVVLGIGVLVGVGAAITPAVAGQSDELVEATSDGLQKLQDWVQNRSFVSKDQIDSALQAIQDKLQGSAGDIAGSILAGLGAITSVVTTLLVTLILSFMLLKDGRRFLPWLGRLGGPTVGTHLQEVCRRIWATLGSFVRAQALTSLIDSILIGTGLLVIGVPLAIPLAVLTFIGGFVPIVGAVFAGAIAVLVALVTNGVTDALIVLALILVVQQIEGNVLTPWLQSKSNNLHAAVILLSVLLGSTLFGIVGAFLAVPAVATVAVILRYLREQAEDQAQAPPGPA